MDGLANPHRLRIMAALARGRMYVSQLAREMKMSRPLLYLHLQKLERAGLVASSMEISETGKAIKYYEIVPFELRLDAGVIAEAVKTLTADVGKNSEEIVEEDEQS